MIKQRNRSQHSHSQGSSDSQSFSHTQEKIRTATTYLLSLPSPGLSWVPPSGTWTACCSQTHQALSSSNPNQGSCPLSRMFFSLVFEWIPSVIQISDLIYLLRESYLIILSKVKHGLFFSSNFSSLIFLHLFPQNSTVDSLNYCLPLPLDCKLHAGKNPSELLSVLPTGNSTWHRAVLSWYLISEKAALWKDGHTDEGIHPLFPHAYHMCL